MWKIRPISLLDDCDIRGNVLRAEHIVDHQHAQDIIAVAQQQANNMLLAAEQQAQQEMEQHLQEYQAQFWQQANILLEGWQQQRQQEQQQLVTLAEQLLNQTMRQLLGDFTSEQRFSALLQQLLKQHSHQQQATLYCASVQQQAIAEWLAQQPQLVWQLNSDKQLFPDQLRLVTQQGELHVDWPTMYQQLTSLPAIIEPPEQ